MSKDYDHHACVACGVSSDWISDQDESLQELLSYCRSEAESLDLDKLSDEFNPYDDIAYKLSQILDGQ